MEVDDVESLKTKSVCDYEEFSEYLLQNSFSSDHYCRYESQKVLHALGTKFFIPLTNESEEKLSEWILGLLTKSTFVANKRILDSQVEVLHSTDPALIKDQNDLIGQMTAQLQSINWLVGKMNVKLEQMMNEGMVYNII